MCEMQMYDTLALQKNNSGSLIAFRIAFASSSFISFGGSFSALISCSEFFPKEILRTSFGLELDGDSLLVLLGGGVTKAAVSASPDFGDFGAPTPRSRLRADPVGDLFWHGSKPPSDLITQNGFEE